MYNVSAFLHILAGYGGSIRSSGHQVVYLICNRQKVAKNSHGNKKCFFKIVSFNF